MDVQTVIENQFYASLETLKQAVEKCPDSCWDTPGRKQFWHVAYHALFYTHLYLQKSAADFTPWAKHRELYELMGPVPWLEKIPTFDNPYTREEILEYLQFCQGQVAACVAAQDMEGSSGFDWQPMSKLELQIYNIRHIQHHAAELIEWLGVQANIDVDWIGLKPAYL